MYPVTREGLLHHLIVTFLATFKNRLFQGKWIAGGRLDMALVALLVRERLMNIVEKHTLRV